MVFKFGFGFLKSLPLRAMGFMVQDNLETCSYWGFRVKVFQSSQGLVILKIPAFRVFCSAQTFQALLDLQDLPSPPIFSVSMSLGFKGTIFPKSVEFRFQASNRI